VTPEKMLAEFHAWQALNDPADAYSWAEALAGRLQWTLAERDRLGQLLDDAIEELEDTGGEYAKKRADELCIASKRPCPMHNPEAK
jgi:hypothetical protein